MLKKVFTQIIFVTFAKKFFRHVPNLGSQIRCAQNRYTSVQIDVKYPPGLPEQYCYT